MPKRTKEWWGRLTKEERSDLVKLERANHQPVVEYFGDGSAQCPGCGNLTIPGCFCAHCVQKYGYLIAKANGPKTLKVNIVGGLGATCP